MLFHMRKTGATGQKDMEEEDITLSETCEAVNS